VHLSKPQTCVLFLLLLILNPYSVTQAQQGGAPLLTYDDLVTLYEQDVPPPELAAKLQRLLTTPFVSNAVGVRGPKAGSQDDLGKRMIRVATWNIERGLEFEAIRAALMNDQRFFRRLPFESRSSRFNLKEILDQVAKLSRADVIVLNEVDWGLKRTNYRNVARELATALQMNYAFGVEFVEVDPLTIGTETFEGETSADKAEMVRNVTVDKSRTLGTESLSLAQCAARALRASGA
jgi:hypothetical protein